jgi:hypothetical protein
MLQYGYYIGSDIKYNIAYTVVYTLQGITSLIFRYFQGFQGFGREPHPQTSLN